MLPSRGVWERPLVQLFDDGPRARIIAVLLDADRPIDPADIVDRAHIGTRSWYNHNDEG